MVSRFEDWNGSSHPLLLIIGGDNFFASLDMGTTCDAPVRVAGELAVVSGLPSLAAERVSVTLP